MLAGAGATSKARFHPRVEADLLVRIWGKAGQVHARARDLSMAGLSLLGYAGAPLEKVKVAIPLPGDREVVVDCQVRGRRGKAVGLQFHRLDWDDFFALARFLHPRLP